MKFIPALLLWSVISLVQMQGQVSDSAKYQSLEPYDFHLQYLRIDSSILIDVREPFEFRGRRLKGAVNIPSSGNLKKVSDTLNMNYALFLYCSTDFRSRNAAEMLYEMGFRNLYNLEGGIVAWRKDGMPVVRGRIKRKKARLY